VRLQHITGRMSDNAETIHSLVKGVSDEQAPWRTAPGKWSLVEVINHLYDEERFDFKVRIDFTLHRPDEQWPPWDPVACVTECKYNERDLAESFDDFMQERRKSLEWLDGLKRADWDKSYEHPVIGELRAGDILAAWLAHDLLHIRQLARLHVDYTVHIVDPYHIRYADPG
jgi:hypothetical protein